MKPEPGLDQILHDFSRLSSADQRAILRLLPPRERKLMERAKRHGASDTLRRQQREAMLSAFSPSLSRHLRNLLDPRQAEKSKATPLARTALDEALGASSSKGSRAAI